MGSCGCSVAGVAKSHIEILPSFPDAVGRAARPGRLGSGGDLELQRVRARSRAFLALFPHLADAERFAGGFRWVFRNAPGLERDLRALARKEHAQSSVLTFVISVQGEELVWQACGSQATEHALDALYGMIAYPAALARTHASSVASDHAS